MRSTVTWRAALAALVFAAVAPELADAPRWPRETVGPDGTRVTFYQPQVESWDYYVTLRFRMAAEFVVPGQEKPIPAALRVQASTSTDLQKRTVTAYDVKVLDITFPSADEAIARRLTAAATSYISRQTQTVALDDVLAHFEPEAKRERPAPPADPVENLERPAELVGETPVILVSQTPAVLVLFDSEPIFVEIERSELEFAINTNWDVFRHPGSSKSYLLHEGAWLEAPETTGPWVPAGKLPKAFSAIPDEESFAAVRANVPGEKLSKADMPRVHVSYRPAELILLDGKPVEEQIPGTDLAWIRNTESDLFRSTPGGDYYYLVSGRWFRASSLQGPWSPANRILPESFAAIPADHPTARVRVSVPGTPEAEEAVMLASIPQKAEVRRDEVTVVVRYDGDPDFQEIEGTTVYYATNTSYDVFRVGRLYYVCFNGVWFVASSPSGPWKVSDDVAAAIYTIPPTSPKYHVTYVYVYDSTPDVVVVGYTSGYRGVYVSNGCVVYGTGWYYPPYVYYPPLGYPVYRAYPYSYGVAAYYNPYTATYGRGAAVYGPYGGAGWGAAYNPTTGTYARGVSAWGPYESAYAAQAYNPRTDTYGATYQRSTPYASWGESVVTRGDEWVHTGYYSDSRGTVAGAETSQGGRAGVAANEQGRVAGAESAAGGSARAVQTEQGSAYVGKDADNNLYAGTDGNVYKRSDDGWSTYDDNGEWQSVDAPEGATERQQEAQGRAEQVSAERGSGERSGERARGERATGERTSGDRSSRTLDNLDRDRQARSSSSQRSQQRESWRSGGGRSSSGSRSSSRGSRSRSGGGRRR